MEPRIVFMGTPEFAQPTLERLLASYTVVGVVTQPDRRAGRGRHVVMPPVKELAVAEGVPVFQPERLRSLEAVEHVRTWAPDLIVVAAYGQILPPTVLEIPPHGVLNVHASLLPRWRGATPIQGALLAGDTVTGVTIMKMDEGLDTGPIVAMREVEIGPEETAGELESRLAQIGAEFLGEILPDYLAGRLPPRPQPEEGVTMTRQLRKSAARIEWTATAEELHNHVRAFAPSPGAYTQWEGKRFKVLHTQAIEQDVAPSDVPGTVFVWEELPAVVTGQGCLALLHVQLAGKRPMDGSTFLRGRKDIAGTVLGSPQPGE